MSLALDQQPVPPPAPEAPAPVRGGPLRRLYAWVLHWAETPYGTPALFALSFAESCFFPIPPDVLQIALSVLEARRSFYYAAVVSALASVAGGIVGWAIGWGLWAAVAGLFFELRAGRDAGTSSSTCGRCTTSTPSSRSSPPPSRRFPFKVFTMASGVFHVPLLTLVLASAVGRSGRFFGVATCIFFFGPGVKRFLDRYLELATVVMLGLLLLGFWIVHQFA